MSQGRGRAMNFKKTERIVHVLRNTDLAISDIAERFICSRSVVAAINRKHRIRDYSGLRSSWIVASSTEQ
jgi:hypothetical protein